MADEPRIRVTFFYKAPQIQALLNAMALKSFGVTVADALRKGICVKCKQGGFEKSYSEAGKREYQISGLCEVCFDEITKGPHEHPDFI